jgi:hypothetical protein
MNVRARRYAACVERYRWAIIAASLAFTAACALLAARLDLRADFSYLLPQSSRSVVDLRAIEARARVIGTAMVVVTSEDPAVRQQTADDLRAKITALDPSLVAGVTYDHKIEHAYAWEHRWLFADLADLTAARDALKHELDKARLDANPLYIPLDDDDAGSGSGSDGVQQMRAKLDKAEKDAKDPGEIVSKDHHVQLLVIRTGFPSGDVDKGRELTAKLEALADADTTPAVQVGVTGDVAINLAEHDAILDGMVRAAGVTMLLVLLGMLLFFRSPLAIGALSWSLVVGTVATFAFAYLALGYLNVATAFLSSIVIGNGINVGILVTSRYLEELRDGHDGVEALANAIEKTIAGTFAAALTAAVAYASLVITVFRGFRHFGIIGGVGILLCWISAYVVLPAALSIARSFKMRPRGEPRLGAWLGKLVPHHGRAFVVVSLAILALATGVTVYTLAGDPFESNFRNLRSHSDRITYLNKWMSMSDKAFGEGIDAGFAIAVDRRDEVAPLIAKLKAVDLGVPEKQRLFSNLVSFDDLLPADQDKKLAVLAEIRTLLSSKDLDALSDADRAEALRLRPPDDLHVLTDLDVPDTIASPFIEQDGSRGKLMLATPGRGYEIWDAHDTVRFAGNVRGLDLPPDVHFGGASFIFADVLEAVLRDGPRATAAAALGAMLVVLIVLGWSRYAAVTLVCGAAGTILMLAAGALLGFKINFLDFVALPITIGIGIEYSVNIVTRARIEGPGHTKKVLASTGGAVFLCSYTTIIGYGSLLLSYNHGIRSFGLAALLGEVACLVVALIVAPALLDLLAARSTR